MTTLYRLLPLTLFCLLLYPAQSQSQYKRVFLIEEGTNASCPPCAAQNPFYESYLSKPHNEELLIPIMWHANFPGRDVMNAANPTMHNTRISYNGISGVPMVRVNGRSPAASGSGYAGAPSDTVGIYNLIASMPQTSPMEITVEQVQTADKISAEVTIKSTEKFESKKLYTAIVEGTHYYANAGTNGEKNFAHVARQMMPSVDGDIITILPGTTTVSIEPATIDPEWNADQLFVIAWIQDDATKEVLQAGTSQGKIHLENDNVQYSVVESQEKANQWDLAFSPTASGLFKLTVETDLPTGWNATVTLDGATFDQGEMDIPLSPTVSADLGVNILSSASSDKKGVGTVRLTITGPQGTEFTRSFRLYSKDLEVLLFRRDEGDPSIPPIYERTLSNGDYVYALIDPTDESMFAWKNYVVLMEVGKWALTRDDITLLRSNIDAGNTRIYLIGAEIGYGLADPSNTDLTTPRDEEFMQNYLHAIYVKDANSSATVVGATNDPIGNGLNFSIKTGIQNQDTPDEIAPGAGAIPSFYYGTSENQVAGIRYADSRNRLVYLGFGAEGIGTEADRIQLLNKGIEWLNGSDRTSGVRGERSDEESFLQNISFNYRDGRLTVDLNLSTQSTVSLQLFDVNGRSVSEELSMDYSEGLHRAFLNVEELASGTYFVGVTANGLRQTKVIVITR